MNEPIPALSLADLRENYTRGDLSEANCDSNPIVQFEQWFLQLSDAKIKEPNAMTLSTVGTDGRPSGRIVLLKEVSEEGFVFYTNYESRKGKELQTNPFAALTFFWAELERQVRVEGEVTRVSRHRSDEYFRSRPRASKMGAWVSRQSEPVPNRELLDRKLKDLEARYAGSDEIPLPEFWGGYCLRPSAIEFWQGRRSRLHDRILYRREGEFWTRTRLSP